MTVFLGYTENATESMGYFGNGPERLVEVGYGY